jgi:hypothetical protein
MSDGVFTAGLFQSFDVTHSKLHMDLFCQEKYLLNHVDLKIKLRRSRDVFALMADADNYGVFTAGLFQSFDVTHSYGRT